MSKLYHAGPMAFLRLLFEFLHDAVFPPRSDDLVVRTLAGSDLEKLYRPVTNAYDEFQITHLLPYANPHVKACIRETKFGGNTRSAELLGHILHTFLSESFYNSNTASGPIILIPLPLSQTRSKERGYNQVERILSAADLPLDIFSIRNDLLYRTRDTLPQTSLDAKDRKNNMIGAFMALPVEKQRTYIVIDDVLTTGSTLVAAAKALNEAGAERIFCVALAH